MLEQVLPVVPLPLAKNTLNSLEKKVAHLGPLRGRRIALALFLLVFVELGFSQGAAPPLIVFVLTDGSQLTGTVLNKSSNQVELQTKSFHSSGETPVSVILDSRNIASCSMVHLGVPAVTIS